MWIKRMWLAGLAAMLVVAGGAVPGGAVAEVSAAQAIAMLNAQRAANGLPADVAERADWSAGCAAHRAYVGLNGEDANPHGETPGKQGYSPAGQTAAQSSVLGGTWSADGSNPYEAEPIDLMQVLAPDLAQTGYAPGCMWTWPGYTRAEPDGIVLNSYPGPGSSIYAAEVASGSPFVPGDFVGLPGGSRTGPYLYVFVTGAEVGDLLITAASVSGPGGPLPIRTVDNSTTGSPGDLGSLLPPGGIVIPAQPLQPGATYRVVVDGQAENLAASFVCTDTECHDDPAYQPTLPVHWDWTFRAVAGTAQAGGAVPPAGGAGQGGSGAGAGTIAPGKALVVRASAVHKHSRLRIDVNPNNGPYRVVVQRRQNGKWVAYRTVRTKGHKDQRSLNPPKGVYRAVVGTQKGYQGATSAAVTLLR